MSLLLCMWCTQFDLSLPFTHSCLETFATTAIVWLKETVRKRCINPSTRPVIAVFCSYISLDPDCCVVCGLVYLRSREKKLYLSHFISVTHSLLFLFLPQWCLPSTRPGVSTVLPAPHATPNWLSSKFCASQRDTFFRIDFNPPTDLLCLSDLHMVVKHHSWFLPCAFRHLSFLRVSLSSSKYEPVSATFFPSLPILFVPFFPSSYSSTAHLLCLLFFLLFCSVSLSVFLASHSASFPTLSGISLWRWIWSQCASTATNACQTTWGAAWPSVSVTPKRRRRSRWYPCVCDALFLSACF